MYVTALRFEHMQSKLAALMLNTIKPLLFLPSFHLSLNPNVNLSEKLCLALLCKISPTSLTLIALSFLTLHLQCSFVSHMLSFSSTMI